MSEEKFDFPGPEDMDKEEVLTTEFEIMQADSESEAFELLLQDAHFVFYPNPSDAKKTILLGRADAAKLFDLDKDSQIQQQGWFKVPIDKPLEEATDWLGQDDDASGNPTSH